MRRARIDYLVCVDVEVSGCWCWVSDVSLYSCAVGLGLRQAARNACVSCLYQWAAIIRAGCVGMRVVCGLRQAAYSIVAGGGRGSRCAR